MVEQDQTDRQDDGWHPELETLSEFAAGRLSGTEAEAINVHLETCTACRLELKQIERFSTIDTDEDLIEEAEWEQAAGQLDGSFGKIIKSVALEQDDAPAAGPELTVLRSRRSVNIWRWATPLAAAAVLVFVMLNVNPGTDDPVPSDVRGFGQGPVRGDNATQIVIILESPSGELTSSPESFVWQAPDTLDSFLLEIFTPALELVFRHDHIAQQTFAVTDSLRSLLAAQQIYLWSVQGYTGIEVTTVSENGWFKILPNESDR